MRASKLFSSSDIFLVGKTETLVIRAKFKIRIFLFVNIFLPMAATVTALRELNGRDKIANDKQKPKALPPKVRNLN